MDGELLPQAAGSNILTNVGHTLRAGTCERNVAILQELRACFHPSVASSERLLCLIGLLVNFAGKSLVKLLDEKVCKTLQFFGRQARAQEFGDAGQEFPARIMRIKVAAGKNQVDSVLVFEPHGGVLFSVWIRKDHHVA